MLNPPNSVLPTKVDHDKTLGERLSGAGLGLFINKVIVSLKERAVQDENSPLPPPPSEPPPLEPVPPPPIPPPVVEAPEQRAELEPGELPESPTSKNETDKVEAHGALDTEDSESMINVQEADLDDSMILQIVAELGDELEEEEKLNKAKDKLAKHLLKRKTALTSKQVGKRPAGSDHSDSVRKLMIRQHPDKSTRSDSEWPQMHSQPNHEKELSKLSKT